MDEYDDYEPTLGDKFQQQCIYCIIPTLCVLFDASFITVGLICLVGADGDFDKCSGDLSSPPPAHSLTRELWRSGC